MRWRLRAIGIELASAVALVCACGGDDRRVKFSGQPIAAKRDPATLTFDRLTPTSGPLLAVPICETKNDPFALLIESLVRFEEEVSSNEQPLNRSLFRNIEGDSCRSSLDDLEGACGVKPVDDDDVRTLNECLVLASGDPEVGSALVEVALGKGAISSRSSSFACSHGQLEAQTLAELGAGSVFTPLGSSAAVRCEAAVAAVAKPGPGCSVATLDACLLALANVGPRGAEITTGVLGDGPIAQAAKTIGCTSPLITDLATSIEVPKETMQAPKVDAEPPKDEGKNRAESDAMLHPGPIGAAIATTTQAVLQPPAASTTPSPVAPVATIPDVVQVLRLDPSMPRRCRAQTIVTKSCAKNRQPTPLANRVADVCVAIDVIPYSKPEVTAQHSKELAASVAITRSKLVVAHAPPPRPTESLPGSAPLVHQGAIINGLADFLVTRARDEVLDYIANEFGRRLCERELRGVKVHTYFAETCQLLQGGLAKLPDLSVRSFGSSLQHALQNDVIALLPTLLNAVSDDELGTAGTKLIQSLAALADLHGRTFKDGLPRFSSALKVACPSDADCMMSLFKLAYEAGSVDAFRAAIPADVRTWAGTIDLAQFHAAIAALHDNHVPTVATVMAAVQPFMKEKTTNAALLARMPVRHAATAFEPAHLDAMFRDLTSDANLVCTRVADAGGGQRFADEFVCAVRLFALAWNATPDLLTGDLEAWADEKLGPENVASFFRSVKQRKAARITSWQDVSRMMLDSFHEHAIDEVNERLVAWFGRIDSRAAGFADLAYVTFHAGRALLRGENPANVFIAATKNVRCPYLDEQSELVSAAPAIVDLRCGLQLAGLLTQEIVTRRPWPDLDDVTGQETLQLIEYIAKVERSIESRLKSGTYKNLDAWVRSRFGGIGKLTLSTSNAESLRVISTSLLRSLHDIDRELLRPGDDRDGGANAQLSAELRLQRTLELGADFLRSVLQTTIRDANIRGRAVEVLGHTVALGQASARRDIAVFAAELFALAKHLGMPDPFPREIQRYLPLVTALSTAETADQAKAAFEKYAAPPGGYRRKFEDRFRWSVSALVGAGYGTLSGVSTHKVDGDCMATSSSCTTGLFLPVGVDVTHGFFKHGNRHRFNAGLLLSVIDLGAIASVRTSGDDGMTMTSEPTWSQVAAPGAYLRFGIWNSPLVVGVGGSLIPNYSVGDDETASVYRFMVFAAADVTIFDF